MSTGLKQELPRGSRADRGIGRPLQLLRQTGQVGQVRTATASQEPWPFVCSGGFRRDNPRRLIEHRASDDAVMRL